LIVLRVPGCSSGDSAFQALHACNWRVVNLTLSRLALEDDRVARAELERDLAEIEGGGDVDRRRLAVFGVGRGGTLAFLLGCARTVAAVIDVDGPVLYPELSSARPMQPLELYLNFEGALLGVFGETGPVGRRERELLAQRLAAGSKDHELLTLAGGEIVVDPAHPGYDAARAGELWRRVDAFLRARAAELDP
jgi:dienelactone hydrolase